MSLGRIIAWWDQGISWPVGVVSSATIFLPLGVLALPLSLWELAWKSGMILRVAFIFYATLAAVIGLAWIVHVIRRLAALKESFYLKHIRPILSSEYKDG